MNVGIIGTSTVAQKHAEAYRNLGYRLIACSNRNEERGRRFSELHGAAFVGDWEALCADPRIDYVDLCTFPEFRLEAVVMCARYRKPILVEKPMATNLADARLMVATARDAGITLGVMSQHRFEESCQFLARAIEQGRLGRILQCDCYTKWFRPRQYYERVEKGSWKAEGGGALINQAIHQLDLIRWFAGPMRLVHGEWQLGATHAMESEDIVSAVVRYESGATGVVQASTSFWPGYAERIEIHGTRGTAILTGDRLTAWNVENDQGAPAPVRTETQSGASEPMAISLDSFERQFLDFGDAIRSGREPMVSGEDGFQALAIVSAIYDSCKTGLPAPIEPLFPDESFDSIV